MSRRKKIRGMSRHHVPPRNPDKQKRFIKYKKVEYHRAYHLLFGAVKSYEEACAILLHDWWTEDET